MGIQRVLDGIETQILMMIKEGELGVVGTTDKAAMGYYVVRWLSEPYSLQADTVGMSGVIGAGTKVVNAIYYNRVAHALFWLHSIRGVDGDQSLVCVANWFGNGGSQCS